MRVWRKTFFSEHPRERGTNQGWVLGEERMQDFDAVMNAKKTNHILRKEERCREGIHHWGSEKQYVIVIYY
jgi:hypothetical protein